MGPRLHKHIGSLWNEMKFRKVGDWAKSVEFTTNIFTSFMILFRACLAKMTASLAFSTVSLAFFL